MPVNYVRREVTKAIPRWDLIRDATEGQEAVKLGTYKYLPVPNSDDTSDENRSRYSSYLARAVYYNVTRRTLDGLLGQVFLREPVIEMPNSMDPLLIDIDGAGVGLNQQAKRALRDTISFGRAGLLVDYPPTETATSKADIEKGFVRPTITCYEPWNIINWRTMTVGAKKLYSMIVLLESYVVEDDGFETKTETQWRVLRLKDTVYTVEIYREAEGKQILFQTYTPKDGGGQSMSEIPFAMIGATNNDEEIDGPPIYDLAVLNIAHYRNSADYEESCYLVGQPTPYFAGLTTSWVTEVLKGKVHLGSRAAIPLPIGGTAGLLQADPNTMPFEAMEHKERQMVALGAKLVEAKIVQRTFGEAQLEEASETSILATASTNVSAAYTDALGWAAQFMGLPEGELFYQLNTDFPAARMSAQERAELIMEWQSGAVSFTEMREQLRKAGIAFLDNEEAKDEIEATPPLGVKPIPEEGDGLPKER